MCGILFTARFADAGNHQDQDRFQLLSEKLETANAYRGPDAQGIYRTCLHDGLKARESFLTIEFFAAELRLRGSAEIIQPHERDGNVLCWNGEVFDGMDILPEENDGARLMDAVYETATDDDLIDLLGRIEGPYAYILYRKASQKLYFGLDPLGRRSLLIHKPTLVNPYFLLSSVSVGARSDYDFEEVSTHAIYCVDLQRLSSSNDITTGLHSSIIVIPRRQTGLLVPPVHSYVEPIRVNATIPPENLPCLESLDCIPENLAQPVDDLLSHLGRSVMLRVRDIPRLSGLGIQARVAILFSGGIDSTVLTLLAHRSLPAGEPIDLLNVAFENPRKSSLEYGNNTTRMHRKLRTDKVDAGRPKKFNGQRVDVLYEVPDRVTGLQELEELKQLCPDRVWNFVEINVPYEESQTARPLIEALMWPRRTVMDLSLAMALYFASRGQGQLGGSQTVRDREYTSSARVLLSGLGSDELLGGYGRHRTAFQTGGWQAVIDELQLELDRIPTRNLGRDDRIISSHGKEVRQPFLSLDVVSFLARLPVHYKSDPRLSLGLGDKMLLRLAARKLGLVEASERKKRAMQFGSHSARMESGNSERRGDLLVS